MKRVVSRCHLSVLTLLLVGCNPALVASPPGPGVPSITRLEAAPPRVWLGCPVQLRFAFEDPEGNAVRAVAHWTWQLFRLSRNGYQVLPIERRTFAGKTTGQAIAWVTPDHIGKYVYHVQLEDAAGRRSNVMETDVAIELGPAGTGAPPTCEPIDDATGGEG